MVALALFSIYLYTSELMHTAFAMFPKLVLFNSTIKEHPSPSHVADLLQLIKSSNHIIWDLLVNQRIDDYQGEYLDKVLRTSTNKSYLLLATEIEIPEELALVDGQPFDHFNVKFHSISQDLRMNQDMADHLFHRCFFTKISEKSPKLISALRFLRDRLQEANVTYVLDAGSLIGSERLFIPNDFANYYKVFYGNIPHTWCQGFVASEKRVELPLKVSNEPFMNRLLWNYFQKLACPKIALPCEFFHNKIPFKIKFTVPDSWKTVELRIKTLRPKTFLIDQIFVFA
ncbi:hypothetical protein Ciccas_008014 [Cichlidogyrus casuarinus]|uniref:Uncharacterized protein n=1 Tax=Cichlidogyrus casuarinus TaxID=1844966 RepID=A0ABD2Q1Y4_9PLAT